MGHERTREPAADAPMRGEAAGKLALSETQTEGPHTIMATTKDAVEAGTATL